MLLLIWTSELYLRKMVLLKGYKMVKGIINNEPLLYRIQWLYKWRKPPKIFCYGIWHFSCHMCQFSLKLAPRLMMVSCDCQKHSEGCAERARGRGGKSFIASDKCTDVLLKLPQHNQKRVSEKRFGQEEKLVLEMHLSLSLTFPVIRCLNLLAFGFIQLCFKLEERLMHLQGGYISSVSRAWDLLQYVVPHSHQNSFVLDSKIVLACTKMFTIL